MSLSVQGQRCAQLSGPDRWPLLKASLCQPQALRPPSLPASRSAPTGLGFAQRRFLDRQVFRVQQRHQPELLHRPLMAGRAAAWISGLEQRCQRCGKRVGAAVGNQEIAACIGNGFVAYTTEDCPIAGITDQPAGQQIAEAIAEAIDDPIAEGKSFTTIANNKASAGAALGGGIISATPGAAIDDFIGEQWRAAADAREF
jgi:hypothetical protein